MNALLAIVREHDTSDRSDDIDRAWAMLLSRARYYANHGTTTCGVCGERPKRAPTFSPTLSCGHPWSMLVWTPHASAVR